MLGEVRIERVAGGHDDERVAVGRRLGGRFGRHHAAGAGTVLDHHGPPPAARQFIAQRAGHDVDRAAGRERHEDVHRPRRKGVLCGSHSDPGKEQHERGE
jgi:hypothetical protein